MSKKTKLVIGLISLCVISAVLASLLTAALMVRGVMGSRFLFSRFIPADTQLSAETGTTTQLQSTNGQTTTSQTTTSQPDSGQTNAIQSPTPAQTVATPTPSATATASPIPEDPQSGQIEDPEASTAASGIEQSGSEASGTETDSADTEATPSVPAPTGQNGSSVDDPDRLGYYERFEEIYMSARASIVGILVEVDETATTVRRTNEGSGLIMHEEGIIVTNSSVINIAVNKQGQILSHAAINVYIENQQRAFSAQLLGRDPLTGLAVLRIDPGRVSLQPAVIAQDPDLRVGQMIVAIGFPDVMQESGSLFTGLISSLNHPVQLEDGTTLQMIQTDARINQRCSGGPLLNLAGEVVGIANCDFTFQSYDIQSYALPAQTAHKVVEDMLSQGYVGGRAWLGVSVLVQDTFAKLQNLYNYPDGLYITNVMDGSPAYVANLRKGDIITEINNEAVSASMNISHFLQSQPVGSLVRIQVYRSSDSQYHEMRVYLQEYEQ